MTDELVTEFTIRAVRNCDKVKVQFIVNGEVMLAGKEYHVSNWGHPYYGDIVSYALDCIIKEGETDERKRIRASLEAIK